MSKEKISGNAVLIQAVVILFFLPFSLFVSYIIISKSLDFEGICFLIAIIGTAFGVVRGSLFYGDIYLDRDKVIVKKITGSKESDVAEIKFLGKALIPSVYFIKFTNNRKVFFQIDSSDFLKQFFSGDSDAILTTLRSKFHQKMDV